MQYTTIALTFAATAFAQTNFDEVVSVLATAFPSSLISAYESNSAAVLSEVASEFEAGNTPAWFTALPTDVQTFLIPVATPANATAISSSATSITGAPTAPFSTESSTLATTQRTSTGTSTISSSGSEETGSSSTSSEGAALPTAVVGMGLAGAAGLVGLLAL